MLNLIQFGFSTIRNISTDPINGVLIFNFSGDEVQRIEILNPNDEVNLVNLSPGIYYIVYWDDNNVVNVTKVMVFE